ncbi:T9SS type A sorting domain-containing protein [bacterium]|nr:T9SS type A sorting domain-containing protein [bacterium]
MRRTYLLVIACIISHILALKALAYFDNQSADFVIGQPDFTSSLDQLDAYHLKVPTGLFKTDTQLFVADTDWQRILIYSLVPYASYPAADIVIGWEDYALSPIADPPKANRLSKPTKMIIADNKLVVVDAQNNRVLIYNNLPTTNGASADIVIGQNDMQSNSPNQGLDEPDSHTLYYPMCVASDGKKLFIADAYNNRVLIFNNIPTTHDAQADVVIGQPDFSGKRYNYNGDVGPKGLHQPHVVYYHNQRLFISDSFNNRVLIYSSIPNNNFAGADIVIGQPDMYSCAPNQQSGDQKEWDYFNYPPTSRTLCLPAGLCIQDTRLFIADQANNRVLIYNTIPETNNAQADMVIGQKTIAYKKSNKGGQLNATTLFYPSDVVADSDLIYVSDTYNHRTLVFRDTTPTVEPFHKGGYATPNPFIPAAGQTVYFNFQLHDTNAGITIRIMNIRGQVVRTIRNEKTWDGRSENGRLCEGGVYIYQIEAENKRVTGKVVLIK